MCYPLIPTYGFALLMDVSMYLNTTTLFFISAASRALRCMRNLSTLHQGTVWGREPVISRECKATFPCLIVTGAQWLKSLGSELEISYTGAQHYRLCSDFPVIDVVSPVLPVVRWLIRPKSTRELPRPSWVEDSGDYCWILGVAQTTLCETFRRFPRRPPPA